MLWSGLLAGLLIFQLDRLLLPGKEAEIEQPLPVAAVDPYAEARRSRAILQAQEGPPPPAVTATESDGGAVSIRRGPVRVIDGDTFVYAGERIRIADIDAPEVQGRCPEESTLAARATHRLDRLLAQGAFELHPLPSGRDEDRYGRKLRIVTRGGRSIADVLVGEGLARTWAGRREPWCG
jgi:micrococcal nuclease